MLLNSSNYNNTKNVKMFMFGALISLLVFAKPAPLKAELDYKANIMLMARTIQAEAGGEPYVGKVAVGAVIMNRLTNPSFPKTVPGIIYQPWAFEAVATGYIWSITPDQNSVRAAVAAASGWDPTYGSLYYWNPATAVSPWIWTRRIITRIGLHDFGV